MKTNYSSGKVGFGSALLITLAGCTTYVQQPPPQTAYIPAPAPVYVQQPAPPPPAPAVVVIQREDDFYQPLSPYGEWVVVAGYGRCWRPARVEVGWRPYSNGHWELTDAGWYWVSDEPWGWATYHYGRWEMAANFGWIWVPQTQWAPAWVSWREGGGYVGWAPLPPEPRPGIRVNVTIAPTAFVFVEERRMREPVRPTTVIVNNTTIINKTVNITKTKIVNKNVVINEGPRTEVVERATGQKIEAKPVHEVRRRQEETVVEKNPGLKRLENRTEAPTPPPEPRRNERARETITPPQPPVIQNQNRVNPEPTPAPQPRETTRPLRREQNRQEVTPTPVMPALQPQPPTPVAPPAAARPNENRRNQERLLREQIPPTNPVPRPTERPLRREQARPVVPAPQPAPAVAPREAQPIEQVPPGLRNRQNPPAQPQVQRPGQIQAERPNGKPEKEKNEPAAPKEKNPKAEKEKQPRQPDGTNTTERVRGNGRQ
jgi:hypothetical protein